MVSETVTKSQRYLAYLLIIGGFIALYYSGVITVEKLHLIQNPDYVPPCVINPLLNCGQIMASWQAQVFGFPNPLLGLAGFPIVITIGFAILAGAQFKRWFWLGAQAGMLFAVGFIYWLFYQAVFVINTLCPYCMYVWTVTIPMFWYLTAYNIEQGHIKLPASVATPLLKYRHAVLALLYGVIIVSILVHFWWFFKTLV